MKKLVSYLSKTFIFIFLAGGIFFTLILCSCNLKENIFSESNTTDNSQKNNDESSDSSENLETFTIIWKNEDGSVLEYDSDVLKNTIPSYDGETPTKESDKTYKYTFAGWDKTITKATEDKTYTAVYYKDYIDYKLTIIRNDGSEQVEMLRPNDVILDKISIIRDGYTFGGIYMDEALNYEAVSMPYNDLTVYVWWKEETKPSNFKYTVNNDNTITINKYIGAETNITIPNYIDNKPVTFIDNDSFRDCDRLKRIVISDTVTSIGNCAFIGCDNLESIAFSDSVISIGNSTFYYCTSLTNIVLPNSIKTIGESAFADCTNLTNINLSNSLISIDNYTFGQCTSLTSITIPDSVTSIGASAFSRCSSLTNITISNSVRSIGQYAFEECDKLTDVYYNGSGEDWVHTKVESAPNICKNFENFYILDNNGTVFHNDTKYSPLTKIVISKETTYLPDNIFWNIKSITSIFYNGTITEWLNISNYMSYAMINRYVRVEFYVSDCNGLISYNENKYSLLTELVIPEGVTSIPEYSFSCINSLKSVIIPDSVISIGYMSFDGCENLTSVTIGNRVTTIDVCAFRECSSLSDIIIPDSVTSLGGGAFLDCTNLKSVVIPNNVKIANQVFLCTTLTTIYFNGTYDEWQSLNIDSDNDELNSARIYYNNEWSYINGVPTHTVG